MTETVEQQLAAARKDLDSLKKEYAEYAHMLSHDFLAVFRQIEGLMQIVSADNSDKWDEKSRQHVELVIRTSGKGKSLVDLLHKYARFTTDSMEIASVNSQAAFDKALSSLDSLVSDKSAIVTSSLPVVLQADEKQLSELFYQLLLNSLTFQKTGTEPRISVTADVTGSHGEFCIADNGIGFAEGYMDDAFSLLKRGVAQTDYPDGVGVGLALADKIVRNHNGKIWIADTTPAGASIRFTLPVSILN